MITDGRIVCHREGCAALCQENPIRCLEMARHEFRDVEEPVHACDCDGASALAQDRALLVETVKALENSSWKSYAALLSKLRARLERKP